LEIGALSPEEIAISIVAELIAVRRNASSASHKKVQYEVRPVVAPSAARSKGKLCWPP
jgi:xanthine/CO dehydrogenase XdhC/CoxF family maturation factor